MSSSTRIWIFAAALCGLAGPARSQNACTSVNQFTVSVVFKGSSLQAITGNSQQTVNWIYDYTNMRQAFQYLASNGSVAQTVLFLYKKQVQYFITPSSGQCEMSSLQTSMPQAGVPVFLLERNRLDNRRHTASYGISVQFLVSVWPHLGECSHRRLAPTVFRSASRTRRHTGWLHSCELELGVSCSCGRFQELCIHRRFHRFYSAAELLHPKMNLRGT